jgi:transposase
MNIIIISLYHLCMNNYPLFFKRKVIEFYKHGNHKISEIIKIFGISNGALYNWINKDKLNKLCDKTKYIKKSKYKPHIKCYIRSYVLRKQTFNMVLLIINIKRKYNIIAKKSSIYKIIKKFNITKKKINVKYILGKNKDHNKKINLVRNNLKNIDRKSIISIDETGIDTHIHHLYGWSEQGKRIKCIKNISRKRLSILCAISINKIIHYKIVNGTINAKIFKDFLIKLEFHKKITNKYLFLDNARIHHSKLVKEYMKLSSNKIIFNAPYSPEYNPIELLFSKLKHLIRKKSNNYIFDKLIKNIKLSFKKIKKVDINNYYKHSFDLLFENKL